MAGSSTGRPLFGSPGEAAALMRAMDWSSTPLGEPEQWPSSIRTIIPIMLASRFAMRVLWGDQFVMIYNDAYRPVLGASKHPFAMGRPTAESFPELWHVVGPMFRRVLAGETVALDDTQLPLDRNGYLEECYFTLSYSPLHDDEGVIGGVLGVVHETTDGVLGVRRMKTLRELSGSALAETTVEAARVAIDAVAKNPADLPFAMIYLVGPTGTDARLAAAHVPDPALAPESILMQSAADIWPLEEDSAAGGFAVVPVPSSVGEIRGSAYPEPVTQAVIIPMSRPGQRHPTSYFVAGVNPRRALDETYRSFLLLASEQIAVGISNAFAEEERTALLETTVAARQAEVEARKGERLAREEAERLNRAKDEFLAVVSHELRNPMSAILGWSRMLRTGELPIEKHARALETIERNALNQSQLIEDLLDVSRIGSGKLRLEVAPVSLEDVLHAALDSARPALDAKQLELRTMIDTTAVALMADGARLQQVVWNLIANATKFTPKGGKISVTLRRVDSSLQLEIRDTGCGISADLLPFVFDRFRQADGSTTRTHGGLGLGLAISKSIVELHGGTIAAHSDGPERGSTFVVTLPVAVLRSSTPREERTVPVDPRRSPWDHPPELANLRVLIVDDDVDGREMIGLVLGQCGVKVALAASAAEAFAQFEREPPDVLLSDIGMPDEDGYSLIRRIRAHIAGAKIPAASLTAYASTEDRRRALLAGFNMHVPKPIDPEELIAVVASLGRFARALR